jgi:hypothetical protein
VVKRDPPNRAHRILYNRKRRKKKNEQKSKWATFTFFGPETRTITKLFRNTKIGISHSTNNNTKHLQEERETKTENIT